MYADDHGRIRVGVTGAAGYLGRVLCRQLVADPWVELVVGLDRAPWPRPDELSEGTFEFYPTDLADPAMADRLIGLDAVCHLAFVLDTRSSDAQAHRTNVEGTWRLLQACTTRGVERVVVASSVSAYGARPDNPRRLTEAAALRAGPGYRYAFHKVLVEGMLDRFEAGCVRPQIVRLRIATVLGPPPRPGAAEDLLRAPVLPLPPSFEVQFVHVDDVAAAFIAALKPKASGVYNVAAEPPLTAAQIAAVTGQHHLIVPRALLAAGSRLLGLLPVADPDRLAFITYPILVDTSRIQTELGWRPEHDGLDCLEALFAEPLSAS